MMASFHLVHTNTFHGCRLKVDQVVSPLAPSRHLIPMVDQPRPAGARCEAVAERVFSKLGVSDCKGLGGGQALGGG